MQILITHGTLARTRVMHFNRWQMLGTLFALIAVLTLLSGTMYHFVFLKAAREGWPVVSQLMKLVIRDELAQRDRFMRENLDAMATKVGEMQAKLIKLESMSERVSGMAGVKPEELEPLKPTMAVGGKGGPFVPFTRPSFDELNGWVASLDEKADQSSDLYTMIEARLLEKKLQSLMVPNNRPVEGPIGSGFGFRADPFSGRAALHTGLDFPSAIGTPIHAAAGGVVLVTDYHPQYGNLVEIDHGRGLVTRYAHTSKVLVHVGDFVKRGQSVALVGTSGRSTGPHLHFEVLLDGAPQNPAKFLALADGDSVPAAKSARR